MYSALGDHVYGRVPLNGFVAKVHGVHVTCEAHMSLPIRGGSGAVLYL
jgi:hypothetical protein